MEICRETIESYKGRLWTILTASGVLVVWLAIEINSAMVNGQLNGMRLWYIVFFAGILVWQYAFRYTCILTDESFIVISEVMGISRKLEVKLTQVEGFSNNYVKKRFQRTGINQQFHRYSAFDKRPLNIFLFNKKGDINAILFKVSDDFTNEMKKLMPDKFFDMSGKKKSAGRGQTMPKP